MTRRDHLNVIRASTVIEIRVKLLRTMWGIGRIYPMGTIVKVRVDREGKAYLDDKLQHPVSSSSYEPILLEDDYARLLEGNDGANREDTPGPL